MAPHLQRYRLHVKYIKTLRLNSDKVNLFYNGLIQSFLSSYKRVIAGSDKLKKLGSQRKNK